MMTVLPRQDSDKEPEDRERESHYHWARKRGDNFCPCLGLQGITRSSKNNSFNVITIEVGCIGDNGAFQVAKIISHRVRHCTCPRDMLNICFSKRFPLWSSSSFIFCHPQHVKKEPGVVKSHSKTKGTVGVFPNPHWID